MPLVSHNELPTFERLRQTGYTVLPADRATHQDIRELHIGLLNMMPDAALEATERQFFRLVGASNQIAQFHVHPFSLPEIKRGDKAREHIDRYYETFEEIQEQGLDALIVSGANVTEPDLSKEVFWPPLAEVIDWAVDNVTSILCSCLTTHAVLQARHNKSRIGLPEKCWGVYSHQVIDRSHPLVATVNSAFDVPHSRFNVVTREQFEQAGLHILVESEEVGVHMAVSADNLRVVYFQGHPEYDTISLLKEYRREVDRFFANEREHYPPFPDNVFQVREQAILNEYRMIMEQHKQRDLAQPEFPEALVAGRLHNTWRDTGAAIVGNWMGLVYQVTHIDRKIPFMEGVDPDDPLGLADSGRQSK